MSDGQLKFREGLYKQIAFTTAHHNHHFSEGTDAKFPVLYSRQFTLSDFVACMLAGMRYGGNRATDDQMMLAVRLLWD